MLLRAIVLAELKQRKTGTLRQLSNELGVPVGTLSDVLRERPGHGKPETIERLARRLGIPVPAMAPAPICPIHGEVHVADCHGQPGAPAWRKPRRVCAGIPEDWHARYRAVIPRPGAHGQP